MGNRWGNSGWLYFGDSKITVDGDCSHEIKRCLLLGRKAMTNLDSILKSRDITLQTKVLLVKTVVFPVIMYGCDSWTVKKAEHRRTDAFELWCWRRLLRVPWTARRSNQSILKEISPGCYWKDWCWSWNSNTLATWWEELTLVGAGEGQGGLMCCTVHGVAKSQTRRSNWVELNWTDLPWGRGNSTCSPPLESNGNSFPVSCLPSYSANFGLARPP